MIELGYAQAVDEVRAGYAGRDRARVSAAISDEIIARIFPYGRLAVWRELIAADYAAGIDTVIVSPQTNDAPGFERMATAFVTEPSARRTD
jgi:hypothetical protein